MYLLQQLAAIILLISPFCFSDGTSIGSCSTDGFFPDPDDCSKYHLCSDGIDYINTCPSGTLWDQNLQDCDDADNVQCPPVSGDCSNFVCPSDNGLFSDPCDCQYYYNCAHGIPYKTKCHEGTLWNDVIKSCDWAYNVDCNDKPSTTTETPLQTTTKVQTQPPEPTITPTSCTTGEFVCPSDGLHADPCDCSSYYNCAHGIPYKYECSDGLLWNDVAKVCDWASNVQCNIQPPVVTTDSPITETTVNPATTITNQPIQTTRNPGTECSKNDYVKICYYSNWAYYRQGSWKYTVDDIDLDVCTHLVYAFAVLDASTYTIKAHDTWLDLPSGLDNYNKFTNLKMKKPDLFTLIAIGGWTDSQNSLKYSDLVADPQRRANFITHVINFIKKYNFDGLDLDWEYPGHPTYGRPQDKTNFALFVEELKNAFTPEGLLLTAAVGASETVANDGYDILKLGQHLDFIHLMTYDLHGSWDPYVDHHSKLHDDNTDNLNSDYTVNHWINNGAPANKLVLGVPIYGRSFTLATSQTTLRSPAAGAGTGGPILQQAGFLSYLEICEKVKSGWTVVSDPSGKMGPYAYSGNQWVGYDDVDMVRKKAQYAKSYGLGGIMVWAIDLSDFNGVCANERYPLLKAMISELDDTVECTTPTEISTTISSTASETCNTEFTCPGDGEWEDPCDCHKYYTCVNGMSSHNSCPENNLWFQHLLGCDYANEDQCFMGSVVPPCDDAATFACTTDDPTIHMVCPGGNNVAFQCPNNLVWSSLLLECVSTLHEKAGCIMEATNI